MDVTLLYFEDCPNWKVTDGHLRHLAAEIDGLTVHHQVIDSPAAAQRYGLHGSPTILVDGVDPFAGRDAPTGLACRLYRAADGVAGSPTLDQLREVLTGASARERSA